MKRPEGVLVEFLRRSYHAVDGLWFMKVEESGDFAAALEMDRQVWEVMAKIQARRARELLGARGNAAADLARCFALKLTADGHEFAAETEPGAVTFTVQHCAWQALLRKSNREALAAEVGGTICPAEIQVWAAEFGGEWDCEMPETQCGGDECCTLRFRRRVEQA